jgi:hypothetical protein
VPVRVTPAQRIVMTAIWGFFLAVPVRAVAGGTPLPPIPPAHGQVVGDSPRESVCLLVESAARAHGLPVAFFARVIWQESRFDADSVGPPTRTGHRAEGIAQFMPATAAERHLLDPFDPVQALPKSAEFLAELRSRFGNLGLAAAAYNAGPQRVSDWLAGTRTLPAETRRYVASVTGLPVATWADGAPRKPAQQWPAKSDCRQMIALLQRTPNAFVAALEQRLKQTAASPWGITLAAGFSRTRVLSTYARLAKRYGDLLKGRDPSIIKSTLRTRGSHPFYQIRVGAETRRSADHLCSAIRHVHGACMVLHNPRPTRLSAESKKPSSRR